MSTLQKKNYRLRPVSQMTIITFFPRGHGNEFNDLIPSLRGPDFSDS